MKTNNTSVFRNICLSILGYLVLSSNVSAQIFPGFDIVGKGYNVFDEFANNKSTERYPLFDFSSAKTRKNAYGHETPRVISLDNISDHIVKTIEGSSITEYAQNLSETVGLSGDAYFFKASVENQFSQEFEQSAEHLFYTYMDINTKWRVNLDTRNMDTLRKYLDVQFKADLATMNPDELFKLYGTHFITHAYLGGRIDYSAISEVNRSISKSEIIDAVNGSYFQISGSYENESGNSSLLQTSHTKTHLNVVGGNSQYARSITNHEQYLKWAEGIEKRPVLCGFDDNSLEPIWTLCSNAKRRKQLEDHFMNVVLPKYPLPTYFKRDEVLDGTEIYQSFKLNLVKFKIHQDCDDGTLLTGDEPGEFKFDLHATANGETIFEMPTEGNYTVWGGRELSTGKNAIDFDIRLHPKATIKVSFGLWEVDDFSSDETVGNWSITHEFPFTREELYNHEENGYLYLKKDMYHSSTCSASFYYQILPKRNQTAYDFGNKGWEEFEKGNYDKCLEYSKEALKVDNSLGYVHYNVALVYLIQKSPFAFEKYKNCTRYFPDLKTVQAALKDINDYETSHGKLDNSEPIKLLLNSLLK